MLGSKEKIKLFCMESFLMHLDNLNQFMVSFQSTSQEGQASMKKRGKKKKRRSRERKLKPKKKRGKEEKLLCSRRKWK